jgi:ABC-type nitrate/sulfonate/bicarbonate transport system substrate-binding protein
LARGKRIVEEGLGYVYRPMDWMNPQLSQAVLVFHKEYLETHREEVQRFVNAYVKRIAYEKSIPEEEKDASWSKGLMMAGKFEDMVIPTYDLPPTLRPALLEEMQDLMIQYGELDKKVDVEDFIDYTFVIQAMQNL